MAQRYKSHISMHRGKIPSATLLDLSQTLGQKECRRETWHMKTCIPTNVLFSREKLQKIEKKHTYKVKPQKHFECTKKVSKSYPGMPKRVTIVAKDFRFQKRLLTRLAPGSCLNNQNSRRLSLFFIKSSGLCLKCLNKSVSR